MFDSSELPIITIYGIYIPIMVMMMIKEKTLHPVKRFVFPCLSILSSVFMMVAACISHGMGVVYYLIIFAVIMAISGIFYKRKKS